MAHQIKILGFYIFTIIIIVNFKFTHAPCKPLVNLQERRDDNSSFILKFFIVGKSVIFRRVSKIPQYNKKMSKKHRIDIWQKSILLY